MPRKSLNDALSNDRAVARSAHTNPYTTTGAKIGMNDDLLPVPATKGVKSSGSWKGSYGPACHESHPPLKITDVETGKELEIFGGSCINPKVPGADIYIGFDRGMQVTKRAFPWNPGAEVFFPIRDMDAPSNAEEFKKMVNWTAGKLREGLKIHCGCIGGHGRTGMFLAALVQTMTGNEDAITYVRANYCKKAVESSVQTNFLNTHFGVKIIKGAKEGSWSVSKHKGNSTVWDDDYEAPPKKGKKAKASGKLAYSAGADIKNMGLQVSIFAKPIAPRA